MGRKNDLKGPQFSHTLSAQIGFIKLFFKGCGFSHGRPQGRARGGSCPPLVGHNSMFFDFFEKNSIFLVLFRQIVCFCPPLEKRMWTPMDFLEVLLPSQEYFINLSTCWCGRKYE